MNTCNKNNIDTEGNVYRVKDSVDWSDWSGGTGP